mgnify:CR=1 FL=1
MGEGEALDLIRDRLRTHTSWRAFVATGHQDADIPTVGTSRGGSTVDGAWPPARLARLRLRVRAILHDPSLQTPGFEPRGEDVYHTAEDDEEDQDDKEEKAARKKRDPRKVVDGRVVLSGEEDGDAAAGGLTPLARASARPIGSRAGALVRAVLDLGADPSLRCGAFDQTPLHYAAACDAVDAAKALVVKSKKAHARARVMDDVDVTDREGFTPLHVAIVCGHLGTVKLLLGPGARASTNTLPPADHTGA